MRSARLCWVVLGALLVSPSVVGCGQHTSAEDENIEDAGAAAPTGRARADAGGVGGVGAAGAGSEWNDLLSLFGVAPAGGTA
ncbi:MAG TPA: hypothetical protein VFN67_22070, partial [Polyangiales bacterium]|nr:hypothetical protein [Polyangiales bacterium]